MLKREINKNKWKFLHFSLSVFLFATAYFRFAYCATRLHHYLLLPHATTLSAGVVVAIVDGGSGGGGGKCMRKLQIAFEIRLGKRKYFLNWKRVIIARAQAHTHTRKRFLCTCRLDARANGRCKQWAVCVQCEQQIERTTWNISFLVYSGIMSIAHVRRSRNAVKLGEIFELHPHRSIAMAPSMVHWNSSVNTEVAEITLPATMTTT